MATILIFAKYDDLAASTRYRFLQYRPWLKDAGIELVIEPLLTNEYLENKYNGIKINRLKIILSYIRRLSLVFFRRNFDLVIVKSPHCQHRFFEAWAARLINVDAPGSTSANLRSLGHTQCSRPMFPLDENVSFEPQVKLFQRH